MRNLFTMTISCLLGCTALSLCLSSCIDDYEVEQVTDQVYASYDIDWFAAADSAATAFLDRFYNQSGTEYVFSYTDYNYAQDSYNCYWQQAHAMAAVCDHYTNIKDSDPTFAATLETYFQEWFDRNANNYESNSEYRGSTGFGNDYTDDTCWIIITLLQLYDATGDETYYDAAKTTWDECVRPRFAVNEYGYLPWMWSSSGANACTNGPGAIVAATLAGYAKDAGDTEEYETYLEEAYKCYDYNIAEMASDGTIESTPLSYTQGTAMEGGRLIWHLTGELGYLRKAILAARGQMTSSSMNVSYNDEYVMRDEGSDSNNSTFHGVLFHWAARMIMDTSLDAYDSTIRSELRKYVTRHASYYWTLGISKGAADWDTSYFSVLCYEERDAEDRGELGAYMSAVQALETMCLIESVD